MARPLFSDDTPDGLAARRIPPSTGPLPDPPAPGPLADMGDDFPGLSGEWVARGPGGPAWCANAAVFLRAIPGDVTPRLREALMRARWAPAPDPAAEGGMGAWLLEVPGGPAFAGNAVSHLDQVRRARMAGGQVYEIEDRLAAAWYAAEYRRPAPAPAEGWGQPRARRRWLVTLVRLAAERNPEGDWAALVREACAIGAAAAHPPTEVEYAAIAGMQIAQVFGGR